MPSIRLLEPHREPAVAAVLARAFRDNPLNRAVIGGQAARRLRANRAGMRATLAAARGRCPVWVAESEAGRPLGALLGMPEDAWPLAPPPVWDQLRVLLVQGPRVAGRWARVFDELAARHPPASSAYLGLVGVEPDAQGRGLGAALVTRWLAAVDAARTPAYLETDRPELLLFYGRFGFEPVERADVLGVRVHFLWRPVAGRTPA
jgi:GNAT superfamily N-acetyltransferase